MPLDLLNPANAAYLWLGAGAVLLMLEILAPGAFLLWLGIAAGLVGAVLLFAPLGLGLQLVLFAVLSLVLGVFARVVLRYGITITDRGTLNKAGNRFTGQVVEVAEPIVNGRGKVKIGDGFWNAEGPDAATGTKVRVKGSKGAVLMVEGV
jgi:inner membrane protein